MIFPSSFQLKSDRFDSGVAPEEWSNRESWEILPGQKD